VLVGGKEELVSCLVVLKFKILAEDNVALDQLD